MSQKPLPPSNHLRKNYRVKIKEVHPALNAEDILHLKPYLGISLSNPLYSNNQLFILLEWITSRFSSCVFLIGDTLNRFNIEIFTPSSYVDYVKKCITKGKDIENAISSFTRNLSGEYTTIRWSQIFKTERCIRYKTRFRELYDQNETFKMAIAHTCTSYFESQAKKGFPIKGDPLTANDLAVEYLIEELSVFSMLIDDGFVMQLYAGTQLPILKKIANKVIEFPEINLDKGVYVDLNLKKS